MRFIMAIIMIHKSALIVNCISGNNKLTQYFYLLLLSISLLSVSCRSSSAPLSDTSEEKVMVQDTLNDKSMNFPLAGTLPPLIIYSTRADYRFLVPVMMDDEKKEIVSFPDPRDLYVHGELAVPVLLERGYLLDRRGIGPNTAFLRLTYEEYATLDKVPSIAELKEMLTDKDPIMEMYVCGNRRSVDEDIALAAKLVNEGFRDGCIRIR